MAKKPEPVVPVDDLRVEAQRVIVAFLKRDNEGNTAGAMQRVNVAIQVLGLPK